MPARSSRLEVSVLLLEIVRKFEAEKIPYLLVGGYALALHGIVRATMDVDLAVSLDEPHLTKAEKVLNDLGLQSRIPVRAKDMAQFHEEYRKNRNLIAWSFVDFRDPSRQVDLLIHPPIRSLKSEVISVHGTIIRVATKKTLLEMKRAANRPEDQLDISRLEEALREEKK
jgi:hypothetical protein